MCVKPPPRGPKLTRPYGASFLYVPSCVALCDFSVMSVLLGSTAELLKSLSRHAGVWSLTLKRLERNPCGAFYTTRNSKEARFFCHDNLMRLWFLRFFFFFLYNYNLKVIIVPFNNIKWNFPVSQQGAREASGLF